ncbi:MAG: hypothetical protein FJ399_16395 [Verrucomicrobia bacterium]|nr:hypothetical protein [Verrucomicrobiota bacterium]
MKFIEAFLGRALLVAALALCCARAQAAESSDLGQSAGVITVPTGLSKAQIRDAIVAAFAGRQWGVTSKTDDRVVGYLKHRSNEATVTMIFDEQRVEMYCVGWQVHKTTGAREKPEQPKGWLNNLRADLTKHLNRTTSSK